MKIFDYKASLAGTNDVGNEAQIIYVVPYDSCLSGGGFLAAEFEFGAYFGQEFHGAFAIRRDGSLEHSLAGFLDSDCYIELRQRVNIDVRERLAKPALNCKW